VRAVATSLVTLRRRGFWASWWLVMAMLVGCSAGIASAQPPRVVTGVVVDIIGAVLPGARIEVVDLSGATHTLTTDAVGPFTVAATAGGRYTFCAGLSEFERRR